MFKLDENCSFELELGLSQLFGPDGPFSSKEEGGPSDFQMYMERIGLPVVTVKAMGVQLVGGPQNATIASEVC